MNSDSNIATATGTEEGTCGGNPGSSSYSPSEDAVLKSLVAKHKVGKRVNWNLVKSDFDAQVPDNTRTANSLKKRYARMNRAQRATAQATATSAPAPTHGRGYEVDGG